MPVILASGSPRRARILAARGVDFTVLKTDAPEVAHACEPERTVLENARLKLQAAEAVLRAQPARGKGAFVLAADTIVWFDNRIYGKPRDLEEAAVFLRQLSGNTHTVFTGVACRDPAGVIHTSCVRSFVTFRVLGEEAIASYVARVRPLDRAGAYDIDASGDALVASYTGSYENIMGLPLEPLSAFGIF